MSIYAAAAEIIIADLTRLDEIFSLLKGEDCRERKVIRSLKVLATEYAKRTDSKSYWKLRNMYARVKMKLKKYEIIIGDFLDGNNETAISEMNTLHHSIVHERLDNDRERDYFSKYHI